MDVPGKWPSPQRSPTPISPSCHGPAPWSARLSRKLPLGEPVVVNDDINVLALVKGRERYIFLFDDSQRAEALRTLGRYASNPELSFTWHDAAVLSQKLRSQSPEGQVLNRITLPQPTDLDE